jgi:ubiquinone/menaquinone biosynthesis C-methylase UbiE
MQRSFSESEPELIDLPSPDPRELRDELENLERLNRVFGATRAVLGMVRSLAGRAETFSVIDLACGYGDIPRAIANWARKAGKNCEILAIDNQPHTLSMAQGATRADQRIAYLRGDIRQPPLASAAADIVLCTLALHHFSESDVAQILREARRVARRGVICVDLVRSRLAYAAVWGLTQFIMRARMTRYDARLSIRRAFTGNELRNLADTAGWTAYWHRHLPWFRQAIGCQIEE